MPCAANCVRARDLLGRGALLLHGGGNRGRDLVDLADDAADALDGVDGLARDLLDVGDLLGDFLGRLRGLARQRFDLGGDHRKAAAGLTGARGLDGGVQRQQVGLGGDGVDQADDFADPPRRFGEPLDGAVGLARLADRAAGDAGRMRRLLADVVDRGAEFFRRRGHRLDAHRGLAGSLLGDLDALVGLARNRRQAGRGGPHLAGSVAELVERLAHHALELADIAFDRLLPRRGAGIALALLRLDPDLVLGLLLEGFQRAGQRADLVLALRRSRYRRARSPAATFSMASRMLCSGLMTRRVTIIIAPNASARAAASSASCITSERRAAEYCMLGVFAGGVERGFGDGDGGAEPSDRDRGPLVRGQFRLLAGGQRVSSRSRRPR